ncbi:predicted protein [Scheffersomyces stipitis CBS 6054]|uniref:CCA tRNA nucleotidyltransferase, mitochondrial n=1 Tax=Scheffersomyces stipitis (strain ATCC 58785 / CBS 6054 / NBRC 10063 / NRRL Y-11545) TaxID=322104 RepID=A3LSZ1_PICST|nr:predicted protein [Scheffersomyces stipitis CBS 6054]ABN65978.2 predicted protein [Scheffersomyces stipitis CBS 6054]
MKRPIQTTITLSETEAKIQNLLVDYCRHHSETYPNKFPLELRITGGWVRDKLLGNHSNDIDIAVNHQSGEQFASNLHEYLRVHNPELHLKAIHTIKKNPEKSKHLETCTTKLFGMDIDFVNLRSEEYSDDSRVPIIKFGTPEEDAYRRDATLNSLFFNLNKNEIEDFTGKGLQDLQDGVLRTPLEPLQTFLDDPLRVLRLIRFASRFNFIVEPKTLEAMTSPEIRESLTTKISKERIEVELLKIFTSKNPSYGLRLINYANLYSRIFSTEELVLATPDVVTKLKASCDEISDHVALAATLHPIFVDVERTIQNHFGREFKRLSSIYEYHNPFWLAVILFPYRGLRCKHLPKDRVPSPVAKILMRNGLKTKNYDVDIVTTITDEYVESREILDRYFANPKLVKRSEMGMYLRKFKSFADLNIFFNCFIDIMENLKTLGVSTVGPVPVIPDDVRHHPEFVYTIQKITNKYSDFLEYIDDEGLSDADKIKPLIDGTRLTQELGVKPGPWVTLVTEEILVWQLDNPDKGADECLEYIRDIAQRYVAEEQARVAELKAKKGKKK